MQETDDAKIIQMCWDRSEKAISAIAEKYGRFCMSIARNILGSQEDAEECVNDSYLAVWNSIPPKRPSTLAPFLGRITRNRALNMYKQQHAEKRGGYGLDLVLEELEEVLPSRESADSELLEKEFMENVQRYLSSLPPEKRKIFVRRYWYADSVKDIAKASGLSKNNISVSLHRMRKDLLTYLEKGGPSV